MAYEKQGYIKETYHYFHLKDCEGQELDFHFHEFDKLVILLSGNVIYSIEHEDFYLKPWDILLVPHHTIHKATIDCTTPYERIILYINRASLRSLAPSDDIMYCFEKAGRGDHYLLHPGSSEENKIKAILAEYESLSPSGSPKDSILVFGTGTYRDTLLLQLLIWINRLHMSSVTPGLTAEKVPLMDNKIRDTLTYMNEHLTEELDVDFLASRLHLSRSYFMHLFKKETGTTVYASILQRRLLFAARKIREGSPANVAYLESGFTDYTTFFRSFKKAFGISPSELRPDKGF